MPNVAKIAIHYLPKCDRNFCIRYKEKINKYLFDKEISKLKPIKTIKKIIENPINSKDSLSKSGASLFKLENLFESKKILKKKKKIHLCEVCNKDFSKNKHLKQHEMIHSGERPYLCDFKGCGKKFSQQRNLNTHKKIHKGEKPYCCEICEQKFTQFHHLKRHTITHVNIEERKKFPCFIINCDQYLLAKHGLKSHMLASHKEEYKRIEKDYPNMNFNKIYKKIHSINKTFDFINFKVFEFEEKDTNVRENKQDEEGNNINKINLGENNSNISDTST